MGMTTQQYLETLGRLERNKKRDVVAVGLGEHPACEDESELHRDIAVECARRMWLCERGSMAHRSRRRIGELDLTIAKDGGKTLWVECKRKGEKPTIEQNATIAWLRRNGHDVLLCYSFEQFMTHINNPKEP